MKKTLILILIKKMKLIILISLMNIIWADKVDLDYNPKISRSVNRDLILKNKKQIVSEYILSSKEKLVLNYNRTKEKNKLSFFNKEGEEIILYDKIEGEKILIAKKNSRRADIDHKINDVKYYNNAQLLTATIKDNILSVALSLTEGELFYKMLNWISPQGVYCPMHTDFDIVIKTFIKKNNKWEEYISFYPHIYNKDVIHEVLGGISIIDKDNYKLFYKGKWVKGEFHDCLNVQSPSLYRVVNRVKIRSDRGFTVIKIKYNKNYNDYYNSPFILAQVETIKDDDFKKLLKENLIQAETIKDDGFVRKLGVVKFEYAEKVDWPEKIDWPEKVDYAYPLKLSSSLNKNLILKNKKQVVSKYILPSKEKLVLNYNRTKEKNKLSFFNQEGEEIILYDKIEGEKARRTNSSIRWWYNNAQLLTATIKGNILSVALSLTERYPKTIVDGGHFDIVIKTFIKKNNKWEEYISFYPYKYNPDVVNEVLEEISIIDKDNYKLFYKNKWIIGNFYDCFKIKESLSLGNQNLNRVKIHSDNGGYTVVKINTIKKENILLNINENFFDSKILTQMTIIKDDDFKKLLNGLVVKFEYADKLDSEK